MPICRHTAAVATHLKMGPVLPAPGGGEPPLHSIGGRCCRSRRLQSTTGHCYSSLPPEVETNATAKPPCALVMSLALALVLLAVPACVESRELSPKMPGPTIFLYRATNGETRSRMMNCLDELWVQKTGRFLQSGEPRWALLHLEYSRQSRSQTLYIAPEIFNKEHQTLRDVFRSLNFASAECRRFNRPEYKSVLWNEVLLYLYKTLIFDKAQGQHRSPRWDENKRAVILLSLYWEFALPILNHPRRSRFYNFLSGSRFTRWLRAVFVDRIPLRLNQLIDDSALVDRKTFKDKLYILDDDGPYVRACRGAGVSNLGRLFVRKLREYDSILNP